jgi:integrase
MPVAAPQAAQIFSPPHFLPKSLGKCNLLYLLKRAGLADQGFTFHVLRHTFATTLLRQNVNPKIVQHQLGHATISQTMDTYSHVMPDMGNIAAAALEEALS